ncbi:MAG TPA: hypothetical protein VLN45_08820 [Ignavibacteriaceae bacterium]|nr:hypothetical protein [Ignavibacteriaceae bacterium]
MQKIEFRKVRDFGDLMNVTFEFIRQNFKQLGKSLLFIAGPFILISGILGGIYQSNTFSFISLRSLYQIGTPFLLYVFSQLLVYLVISLISFNFVLLYIKKDQNQQTDKPIEVDEVWEGVRKYFWMAFFTMIGSIILTLVGLVFLIVPGIYLSIVLVNLLMIRMNEGLGFIDAVKKANSLISKNWWFTFAFILILSVIEYFFSFIFQLPQLVVSFIIGFSTMSGGKSDVSEIIIMIASIFASFSLFFYIIMFIGLAFHYFNLVEQKEAVGLLQKIESI